MAYLGIAALVFFLIIIPLLLVAVTVAAFAGKVLARTANPRRRLEQNGERPTSDTATRAVETELLLDWLGNRERPGELSVSQKVSQGDRSLDLSQEAGVYTLYLKLPDNENDTAEGNPLPWARSIRESDPDLDRHVRKMLSSFDKSFTNGFGETDVVDRSPTSAPRRLDRQSRSVAETQAR